MTVKLQHQNQDQHPQPSVEATDQFDLLRVKNRHVRSFPASLKIAVWNCRGVASKSHTIRNLFLTTGADLLVLNETFRRAHTPWPSDLPPCLAEATALSESQTRQPNGVAVLVNPDAIGLNGSIRSFSILEVDNIHGLKVTLKVNQFILIAVYVPTSLGPDFFRSVLNDANLFARDQQPVILCGDLNAIHAPELVSNPAALSRHRILASGSGYFHRVDTGLEPTRPSNRIDSVDLLGTIIDHIYVANANALDGACISSLAHSSDHHPIFARIISRSQPTDYSLRYWRLRTEKLQMEETRQEYKDAIMSELGHIRSSIGTRLPADVTRLAPANVRQRIVDDIELDFVSAIMKTASRIIGKKAVPIVPRTNEKCGMSSEYRDVSVALTSTYASLIQLHGHGTENRRVADLLIRRDSLRARLNELNRSDQAEQYRSWKSEFESLPIAQRLKVINRSVRRRSAAGACLSSTPLALESYKEHFKLQFTNDFGMEPFVDTPNMTHQGW